MAGDNPMRAGAFLLALSFLLFGPLAASAGDGRIVLEADRVEFDQASGFAVATGAVCISRDLLRVFAPRIEYSAVDNTIEAFSEPGGKKVVLFHGPQRLEGEHLALDMVSGEGLFRNASGGFPAEKGEVYASGSDVTTTRFKEGQRFGSIPGRVQKDLVTGDQVYQWRNVGFTTCPAENPHYQLVSKRLVVIPGFRLVASKPAVYIGGKFLLSYPFDYVIDLSNGSRSQFLPQVMYEGDKGVGVSYGAPLAMGDVNARWKAFLWSGVGLEAVLSVDHRFSDGIVFFADASYTWDGDRKEKRFRPSWGVDYEFGGWTGRLWWSRAESVEVEKDLGETFEGLIDRSLEFTLLSPWWTLLGVLGRWRLMGTWGDYEVSSEGGTVKSSSSRLGLGAAYEGETKFGNVAPFWGAEYWWYDYGSPGDSQKVMTVRLGLAWPLGPVTMTSLWRKRWVEGGSPMAWDELSDSEVFYQKAEIPFGEHWSLAVRGGYNLRDSSLDEMYYRLSYDSKCCFRVELVYRDDRVGEDDWAGMVFVLNAFPSHPFFLGAREAGEYAP